MASQCLLKVGHGLPVGRARCRLGASLPAVGQGLVPHLAPQGMVGQPFDLFGQTVGREPCDGLDDAGCSARRRSWRRLLVGHLVSEGVLEGIGSSGKRLVS